MDAGGFATGGTVLFAACGARLVTLGLGTAAGAGREADDGGAVTAVCVGDVTAVCVGDVTAGCGALEAWVAGGGDGATCP